MKTGLSRFSRAGARVGMAAAVLAGWMLLSACGGKETLEVDPDSASLEIPIGSSDSVDIQVFLPENKLHSVTLPVDVEVVSNPDAFGQGISVSADPSTVELSERGTAESATLTVSVLDGTVPGTHLAVIRPAGERVDGGRGILIAVTVPDDPPTVTIDTPEDDGDVGTANIAVTGTIHDPNDNVAEWQVLLGAEVVATGGREDLGDGGQFSVNVDGSGLEDETEHTIEVTATDEGGNSASASSTFTVHRNAPTAEITTPAEGDFVCQTFDVTGTIDDPDGSAAGWTIKLDGTEVDSVSVDPSAELPFTVEASVSSTSASDGSHTLLLEAADDTGLTGSASVTITVANELTATITKPAAGRLYLNDDAGTATGGTTTVIGAITATVEIPNREVGSEKSCRMVEEKFVCFRLNGGDCADPGTLTLAESDGKVTATHTYDSAELQSSNNVITVEVKDNARNSTTATSTSFDKAP